MDTPANKDISFKLKGTAIHTQEEHLHTATISNIPSWVSDADPIQAAKEHTEAKLQIHHLMMAI